MNTATRITVTKGLKARNIQKGERGEIVEIIEGERRSATVRIRFLTGFVAGKTMRFHAQHMNRLGDPQVRVNTGDPTKTLVYQVRV